MASSGRGVAIFGILIAIVAAGIGGYTFLQVMNLQESINDTGGSESTYQYITTSVKVGDSLYTNPVETWIEVEGLAFSIYPKDGFDAVVIYSCQAIIDCPPEEYSNFGARIVKDDSPVFDSERYINIAPQSSTHNYHQTHAFTLHYVLTSLDTSHSIGIQIYGSETATLADSHVLTVIYNSR